MHNDNVKVLHLLVSGTYGGIESLINNYADYSKLDNQFVFAFEGGEISEEMKNKNHKVEILNGRNNNLLYLYKQIDQICKKEQIDILVTHHSSVKLKLIALILKQKYKFKLITYAHSAVDEILFDHSKFSFIKSLIARINMKHCDSIFAVSNYIKNGIVERIKVKENKVSVIYNCIDLKNITPKLTKTKINNLIYVGRLKQAKGIDNIINALNLMDSSKYSLTIVGKGDYSDELKELSKSKSNITFTGKVVSIYDYLYKADAFIHIPNWNEGFGITTLEAMASGLIFIGAINGATPELIIDGYNGFLIEKSDPNLLKDKIEEINSSYSEEELLNIRKNAIETAKKFSAPVFAENLDKLFKNELKA